MRARPAEVAPVVNYLNSHGGKFTVNGYEVTLKDKFSEQVEEVTLHLTPSREVSIT